MMIRLAPAFATIAVFAVGCSTVDAGGAQPSGKPTMAEVLSPIAKVDPDGLNASMRVIGAHGISAPHDPGARRTLADAELSHVGGDGPESAIWFQLASTPCYTIKNAERDLGGSFREFGEGSYRRENQVFLISARMSKDDVNCIGHMMIVKQQRTHDADREADRNKQTTL